MKKESVINNICLFTFVISISLTGCGTTNENSISYSENNKENVQSENISDNEDSALNKLKETLNKKEENTELISKDDKGNTTDVENKNTSDQAYLYKLNCIDFDYKSVAREMDGMNGNYYRCSGKVLQVIDDTSYRVDITETDEWGYSDCSEVIVIKFKNNTGRRILEGDYITVWGQSNGLVTYETVMGSSLTVPSINAKYVRNHTDFETSPNQVYGSDNSSSWEYHLKNDKAELTIIKYDSSYYVELGIIRLVGLDNLSANLVGNILHFHSNSSALSGEIYRDGNNVILEITESDWNYMEPGMVFVFNTLTDELPLYGQLNAHGGTLVGYTKDYVKYGFPVEEIRNDLENGWHIVAKDTIYSQGITWYSCWDSDDGDYYGWIASNYIDFY